jgi:hypothetical protein
MSFRAALLALLVGLLPLAAPATSVRPLDLNTIVDHAVTAFQGVCTDSHSERDAATGSIVTITTFKVEETLKGAPASVHTIKQIGGRVGNQVDRVDGIPSFTPGERYVVFLYGKSQLGFSSPVALAQGRFTVRDTATGRVVSNGRDFRDMLPQVAPSNLPSSVRSQLSAAPGAARQMDLDEFKRLVHGRTGQ